MELKMQTTLSETQKAYFAGFFDGEGCISLFLSNGSCLKTIRVSIAQKDQLELLQEIQTTYGGGIVGRRNSKSSEWFLSNKEGIQLFLSEMLPHLRVKRAKAEVALAICELMGKGRSDREVILRSRLQDAFEQLVAAGKEQ